MDMAGHPKWLHTLFSDEDLDSLIGAIRRAEAETSGEIRLHLERRLPTAAGGDALARAREVFERLGMQATAERNGVLIYLAIDDHRLAVVGDDAVHARVGDGYWNALRDGLVERLRAGRPREALVTAIENVGATLRHHFPRGAGDANELSDDVSAG